MAKRRKTGTIKNCKFCGKEFLAKKNSQYCSRKCATTWRRLYGYHYIPKPTGKPKDTLCWQCKKSTSGSDCPWANRFEPVDGWNATSSIVKMGLDRTQESFFVHECPLFERG